MAAAVLLLAVGVPAEAASPSPTVFRPGFAAPQYFLVGSEAVVVADFTGDGRADVAALAHSADVTLLVQTPSGALATPQLLRSHAGDLSVVSEAAADVDADGDIDLVTSSSNGIEVFEQRDGGLLPARHISDLQVYEIDVADLDGDGRPDLVVDTISTTGMRTMLGLGGGEFGPAVAVSTDTWPYGELEVGDVTGDGIPDIVGHMVALVEVRPGLGDGTFAAPLDYPIPWPYGDDHGLALGDFDGDGRTDAAVTNSSNRPSSRVYVFHQTPNGTLGTAVPLDTLDLADALEAADVNLDGRTDLVTAHGGWNYAGVYVQRPDGTFAPEQLQYTRHLEFSSSQGLDLGDVDGDGLPDIVVGSASGLVVVRSASRVQAWGLNNLGQLGTGGTADVHAPAPTVGPERIAATAAGGYHNLAVTYDGTVLAWGLNSAGQLGDGTTIDRASPARIPGLVGVKAVAGGTINSAAVGSDGTLWTWGWNQYGQLGSGATSAFRATPGKVPGLTGVTAVAVGLAHTLAVTSDGSVWAWGLGHVGQLGNGSTASSTVPVKVAGLTDVVAVAAGNFHSLALTRDGSVWSWGLNDQGQLGIGSRDLFKVRPTVTTLTGTSAIGAGAYHSVALSTASVWAWGMNNVGELGDGMTVNRSSPVKILCCAKAIAVGGYHTLALMNGGTALAWGWNYFGQLGTASTQNALLPVEISSLYPSALAAGLAHTVAITPRGG